MKENVKRIALSLENWNDNLMLMSWDGWKGFMSLSCVECYWR